MSGLRELEQVPGWLEDAQRRFLDRATTRLRDSLAEAAPGGAGGSVGRATRARTLSSTKAEITIEHPGAKALDRGAFIRPKRGQALRFRRGGEVVYTRRGVRLRARHFTKKGLRARGRIVRQAYAEAFDELGGPG